MTDQPKRLFTPPPADPNTLPPRQQRILSALEGQGHLTDHEAGMLVGWEDKWTDSNGRQILYALRRKGLAKYSRKRGRWEPSGGGHSRQGGEIPY